MTGRIAILILACALPAAVGSAQEESDASSSRLSPAEGAAAVGLARQAMLDYLRDRITVESASIPERAQPLAQKSNAAAVSLRSGGALVGQAIRRDKDLSRSVVAAALAAVRSPKLPDVVRAEFIQGLTVEVEVLGPPVKIEEANLAKFFVGGLTGVTAARGMDEFTLLPSVSYATSLAADDVRGECLSHLPPRAETTSLPVRWVVFASSHYVGFPAGGSLWLRQGRTPLPPEMIDANALTEAAQSVGLFLLANQGKDGTLAVPREGAPPPAASPEAAAQAPLPEQLYATFALARLAKATGRKEFVNLALTHATARVRQEASYAYLVGIGDEDQLAAVSFLVLAVGETPDTPQGAELCRKLLATVDKALLRAEQDKPDAPSRSRLPIRDLALAHMASSKAEPNNAARLRSLRAAMGFAPADTEGVLWLLRAGLREDDRSASGQPMPWPVLADAETDLAGSFAAPGRRSDTLITALSAVNLAARRIWPGLTYYKGVAVSDTARKQWLMDARRFCYQMLYRPREAYFAAKPELWTGGVRASPQGAKITLAACAAAIEALLAE